MVDFPKAHNNSSPCGFVICKECRRLLAWGGPVTMEGGGYGQKCFFCSKEGQCFEVRIKYVYAAFKNLLRFKKEILEE